MADHRSVRNKLVSSMFELRKGEFSRCFWPDLTCMRPAIHAHSVQNSKALDLLSEGGNVVALALRLNLYRGPSIDFQRVGRNRATTFTGLCAQHDCEIFAPIESEKLDLADPEHRFLLAYRAAFYEVHATGAAAWLLQSGYQKRVELGLDSGDEPSPAGMAAVERMIVSHQVWKYKSEFDLAYLEGSTSGVEHDLVELTVERPTIAASALFALDGIDRDDGAAWICLTVLPTTAHQTVALFSYLSADSNKARLAMKGILTTTGAIQKYELSKRLINHCQNFVLAPSFVESWTEKRRGTIMDLFVRTVGRVELGFDDPSLMLFT